jgi:hypothetical protein
MRTVAFRASAADATGWGFRPETAVDDLARAIGHRPRDAEITIDPIVIDPDPELILFEVIRHEHQGKAR